MCQLLQQCGVTRQLTFLALPQFHKRPPPSVAWTKPCLDSSLMHKDDATRILRKYDIHHDLSTGKEQVKKLFQYRHFGSIAAYVRTYSWPVKGINLLVSAKPWEPNSRQRWAPISEVPFTEAIESIHIQLMMWQTCRHKASLLHERELV